MTHSLRLFFVKSAFPSIAGLLVMALLFLPLFGESRGPKLILFLSVDQMHFEYLSRFANLYRGGLRTLLERGAVFTNAKCGYADTETAPGHSVMLSGRHPSHSGIIANSWVDPYLKKTVASIEDPVVQPVGGQGHGSSPHNFMGFTLGDFLKVNSPGSKVVGVSLKDRSAILMAGPRADAAYWYSSQSGKFTTSTYYATQLPDWLTTWNKLHRVDPFAGKSWTRLLSDLDLYEKLAGPDRNEGEGDGKDNVFPHAIRGNPPDTLFYENFQKTPFADEVTMEVALLAMKAHHLGRDLSTDILAISFSATDFIGHTYGPDSQEIMDQLLRLDQLLKKLFEAVDETVGMNGTWVVLTADHGSLPLVENLRRKGIDARRISLPELRGQVQQALSQTFPSVSGVLLRMTPTQVYLDLDVIQQSHLDRRQVEECVRQVLVASGNFEAVYPQVEILDPATPLTPLLQLVRNSFYQPRSPQLTLIPKPYYYLGDGIGGTGHGTPHDYDRQVPIVFMGDRVRAGQFQDPALLEDIAPTLADMLGLKGFPQEADSRILREMYR
ncbi:MAG: alkaline phosphatase family protein [Terriglobia bacterium]